MVENWREVPLTPSLNMLRCPNTRARALELSGHFFRNFREVHSLVGDNGIQCFSSKGRERIQTKDSPQALPHRQSREHANYTAIARKDS